MKKEIVLLQDETVNDPKACEHNFVLQADVKLDEMIYDIYFCSRCLIHVKKERPCPYELANI